MVKYGVLLLVIFWGMQYEARRLVGPFEVEFKQLYRCDSPKTPYSVLWEPNYRIYNRTTILYTSNVTFPNDFDDSMKASVDVSVFTGDEWRSNYINFKLNKACTQLAKTFPYVLTSFMEGAGTTFSGCPVKKGTYNVRNWKIDVRTSVGLIPYNSYKIEARIIDSGRIIYCAVLEVDIVPKQ